MQAFSPAVRALLCVVATLVSGGFAHELEEHGDHEHHDDHEHEHEHEAHEGHEQHLEEHADHDHHDEHEHEHEALEGQEQHLEELGAHDHHDEHEHEHDHEHEHEAHEGQEQHLEEHHDEEGGEDAEHAEHKHATWEWAGLFHLEHERYTWAVKSLLGSAPVSEDLNIVVVRAKDETPQALHAAESMAEEVFEHSEHEAGAWDDVPAGGVVALPRRLGSAKTFHLHLNETSPLSTFKLEPEEHGSFVFVADHVQDSRIHFELDDSHGHVISPIVEEKHEEVQHAAELPQGLSLWGIKVGAAGVVYAATLSSGLFVKVLMAVDPKWMDLMNACAGSVMLTVGLVHMIQADSASACPLSASSEQRALLRITTAMTMAKKKSMITTSTRMTSMSTTSTSILVV
eukprot:TRINITY_DN18434_c0_g1_i3.p1 TRINITY_DN18434_c0_g1~~TRINITY_DN18434_c0_g1_i3.p1  ORF type:complete len:400 (-),score=90.11 TRINITY_DN18434_c0_g1_i3:1087-2286(-)